MPAQPMILVPRKSRPRGPDLLPSSPRQGSFAAQDSIVPAVTIPGPQVQREKLGSGFQVLGRATGACPNASNSKTIAGTTG